MNPIAAIGPLVQTFPPQSLREKLRSDEQLVWWSAGRGSTLDSASSVVAGMLIVAELVLLALQVRQRDGTLTSLSIELPVLFAVYILPMHFIDARYQIYGLTNQRLIFIPGFPPAIWWAVRGNAGSGGAIHMFDVTGRRARGNVRLQSSFVRHGWLNIQGLRLTGVDDPLEVAALIKSTLDLDLPIEDHTT